MVPIKPRCWVKEWTLKQVQGDGVSSGQRWGQSGGATSDGRATEHLESAQLLASFTVSIATYVEVLDTCGRLESFSPSTAR